MSTRSTIYYHKSDESTPKIHIYTEMMCDADDPLGIRMEMLPTKRGAAMIRRRGDALRLDRRIAEKLEIAMRIVLAEPVPARTG